MNMTIVAQQVSLMAKDVPKPTPHPCAQPVHPDQMLEAVDSSDDELNRISMPRVKAVGTNNGNKDSSKEPEEEDDITELSMCRIHLFVSHRHTE